MNCVICRNEFEVSKYEEYNICKECSELIDDIIAAYFELLERDLEVSKGEKIPYYVLLMSRKLKFLEQTMWWTAYEEAIQKGEYDDEYFQRLENVVRWFNENTEIIRRIGEKYFARCDSCNAELLPGSVTVEEKETYSIILCKKCGNEILRYHIHKKLSKFE